MREAVNWKPNPGNSLSGTVTYELAREDWRDHGGQTHGNLSARSVRSHMLLYFLLFPIDTQQNVLMCDVLSFVAVLSSPSLSTSNDSIHRGRRYTEKTWEGRIWLDYEKAHWASRFSSNADSSLVDIFPIVRARANIRKLTFFAWQR